MHENDSTHAFEFKHRYGSTLRLLVALALSCLLIFTGGCSLKKLTREGNQGEQLVLVTSSDPSSFNYAAAQFPYLFFRFIYKGLVAENGITAELEPALAESWGLVTIAEELPLPCARS